MAVKNLLVRGGADFSGMQKEMAKAQKSLANFQSNVGSIMKKISALFGGIAIGKFVKDSIKAGSDVAEIQNVVDVTFGAMSKDIEDFAKSAMHNFGLGELATKKYASTMGAMLKSSGINGKAMKDMSLDLTRLTADMASFFNMNNDEMFTKIMSGMSGMSMPLKELGINMNIANLEAFAMSQGITKAYQDMSQAEQTMLRYNYLLSVTGDMQGDFSRNSHNWGHSLKILTEQWNTLKATLGQGFINILQPVVTGLNILIKKIQVAAEYFRAFTELIFGNAQRSKKTSKNLGYTANNMKDVGSGLGSVDKGLGKAEKGLGKAGKAGKKAGKDLQGSISAFDEINQVEKSNAGNDDIGSGGGIGGGIDGGADGVSFGEIDLSGKDKLTEGLEGMTANFKRVMNDFLSYWGNIGKMFEPGFNNLSQIFHNGVETAIIFLEPLGEALGDSLIRAKEGFDSNIPLVADSFNYLTGELLEQFENLFDTIQINAQPFADNVRIILFSLFDGFDTIFPPVLKLFTNFVDIGICVFGGFGNSVAKIFFNLMDNLAKITKPGMELVSRIIADILGTINGFFDRHLFEIKEKISTTWENITNIVTTIFNGIGDTVHDIFGGLLDWWEKNNDGVKETFSKTWEAIWAILEPIWNIINDVAHSIWEGLEYFFDNNSSKIADLIVSAWNLIWSIIKPLWDTISDIAIAIFTDLKEFWDNWGSDILGIFKDVWHAISDVFGGVLDIISGIFKIFAGIFKGDWSQVWQGVKQVFSGVWNSFIGIVKGVLNGIIGAVNIAIKLLNKFSFDVPDWIPGIGGKSFGFNLQPIPKLAKGGITNGPTLALVGDNPGGKEVVSPLDKLQDMLVSAVGTAMLETAQFNSSDSNSSGGDVYLQIDGTTFARLINPYSAKEKQRLGNNVILQTT